jgi:hypothetical protein
MLRSAQIGAPGSQIDWQWLDAMRADRGFRIALDLQRLMLRRLLGVDLDRFAEPAIAIQFPHRRRIFKMRRPELEYVEWRIVRRALRMTRNPGLQTP